MRSRTFSGLMLAGATLALSACGGGGGGGIESMPPAPIVVPTPTPPPPPPGDKPLPPEKIGLVSSAPFAVLGIAETYTAPTNGFPQEAITSSGFQDVQFSYDPSSNSYQISLPGFEPGTLAVNGYNGTAGQVATSSVHNVLARSTGAVEPVFVTLQVPGSSASSYTYTSWGYWSGQSGTVGGQPVRSEGYFVYGIPTASGDVPITGSASYTAQIQGSFGPGSFGYLGGTASLLFDFGQGKLSGSMHPFVNGNGFGPSFDFGQFDFTNTVYARGSTTFSGQFIVPGLPNADSSFSGNFTGPNANEVMARFQTPYLLNGQQGMIAGIWIGRRN